MHFEQQRKIQNRMKGHQDKKKKLKKSIPVQTIISVWTLGPSQATNLKVKAIFVAILHSTGPFFNENILAYWTANKMQPQGWLLSLVQWRKEQVMSTAAAATQDGEALVQLCVLPAQAHIHNKQEIGCFSPTAHIPRNTNSMTYHLEAVEEKIQLSRHPINLCTHLDCTSIWQIYFIFIVVSKKSGSSWSMKSLKPWFLLKCSSRKPVCSRFPSWHSSKDPAKLLFWPAAQSFLLLCSLLKFKTCLYSYYINFNRSKEEFSYSSKTLENQRKPEL